MKTKNILSIILLFTLVFSGALYLTSPAQAEDYEISVKAQLGSVEEEVVVVVDEEEPEEHMAAEEEPVTIVEEVPVVDSGLLMARREEIAQRQAVQRRYAAEEEQEEPNLMAAILPVTGSVNLLSLLIVSFILGMTLPYIWGLALEKIRKDKNI